MVYAIPSEKNSARYMDGFFVCLCAVFLTERRNVGSTCLPGGQGDFGGVLTKLGFDLAEGGSTGRMEL